MTPDPDLDYYTGWFCCVVDNKVGELFCSKVGSKDVDKDFNLDFDTTKISWILITRKTQKEPGQKDFVTEIGGWLSYVEEHRGCCASEVTERLCSSVGMDDLLREGLDYYAGWFCCVVDNKIDGLFCSKVDSKDVDCCGQNLSFSLLSMRQKYNNN
ncbi:unnamed protein product [Vicia faba]|uniref:Uncharacterized protein n=1 Tax=Vicia faba TaxID=3906 RepID=A0AAV1B3I7_VICFA|nr:unnamed protein product [Vicia faba]